MGSAIYIMSEQLALELRNITKRFGSVIANNQVSMTLKQGEILAVLGENGSGKTSLMNIIAGIYYPDEGEIFVKDKFVQIFSPKDAFINRIGMVHQHFKLVDCFTAVENVVLGLTKEDYKAFRKTAYDSQMEKFAKIREEEHREPNEKEKANFKRLMKSTRGYNLKESEKRINRLCDKFGFKIDPNKRVYEMSVGEKQTLEIIKILYRGADVLILDEPTAVLTPQETEQLFEVLRNMRDEGKSIIIITHKLNEVMEISDRVTVLRKGKYIGSVETSLASKEMLTEMMVGEKVSLDIERKDPVNPKKCLEIKNLSLNKDGRDVLKNINLVASSGEILGIAGIAGSGQRELLETIAGLEKAQTGNINYYNYDDGSCTDLRFLSPIKIHQLGVRLSFVPEDRLGMGLVGNFDLIDNTMLRSYEKGRSIFLDRKKPSKLTKNIVDELNVKTPNLHTEVRTLSGGNVQKVLVGREIASGPKLLMAAYPVRGLDVNSSYLIYNLLNQQKENGTAVIYVGEDLDVLLALCDKVAVICDGMITGVIDPKVTTKEEVGKLMIIEKEDVVNGQTETNQ